MQDNTAEWYIIVNPRAGSGKTMSSWPMAEKKLKEYGIRYKTAFTDHPFHAKALGYEAAATGYKHILAVGGDGSVHETFCGIMRYVDEKGLDISEFHFGVIPIGSGNDWIKMLKVPHDVEKVVDLVARQSYSKMDVVKVETSTGVSYMANIGGCGFDSHVCERVNRQKAHGKQHSAIYFRALLHTIRWMRAFNAKVVADGVEIYNGLTYSIAFGNGMYSGGGMRQVPEARMDDGILDYMVCPKCKVRSIVKELPKLFTGSVNECGLVHSGKCREITITSDKEESVEMDGEIEGNLPLKITMTGKQINVLTGDNYGK